MDLSLDRIKLLLKRIGQPQHSYPIIHVTGTNGKGSVCYLLSTILCKAGYKVGRFTSPHLVRWTECISVDDNDISPHSLSHAVSVIADAMHRFNISLTQFEALTAAAYYHFHKEQVEVGVIEVGMGGRLDATNVTDSCLLAIITSIGLDHVNVLGKTKVDIAKQKMGIIKPGCHAILACSLPPEVVLVISQYATSMNSHVVIAQTFDTNGDELSLKGEHQRINFGTVMAAIDVLRTSGWDRLANRAIIAEALKSVKWVARLQCICWKGREVWIDGGHNTDAGFFVGRFARSLLRTRNEQATHIHWIIGMLSHKDHIGFLRALLTEQEENDSSYSYSSSNSVEQVCQTTTFVPVTANVGWLRGESPQALAKLALSGCSAAIDTVDVQLSVTDALDSAIREDENAIIMVTGSLHLCGEVLASIEQEENNLQPSSLATLSTPSAGSNLDNDFRLLETIRWEQETGFFLLEQHLDRLFTSAKFFGFDASTAQMTNVKAALSAKEQEWKETNQHTLCRVRLLLDRNGITEIQRFAMSPVSFFSSIQPLLGAINDEGATASHPLSRMVFKLKFAPRPVESAMNPFLYHKTTNRSIYESAAEHKGEQADDVILYNEHGEVTETCIANIAIARREAASSSTVEWVTPPVTSGLLAGCMRYKLLATGQLVEGRISVDDLRNYAASGGTILLFNSVRGVFEGRLLEPPSE